MPARFQVRLTEKAYSDMDEIWTFIARDSVTKANRFIHRLERQLKTLRRLPERCPLIPENELLDKRYRHLLYGKYRTVFRISGRTVYVVRIIHGARLLDTSMLE
jgi:plasmid stabilization system protein ParE